MESDRRANWLLGIGVTVGLALGLAIGRRGRMQRMPHLDAWQRTLAEQWGETRAAMLASRVLARHQALYARRPHFARRALRVHMERDILPGLALYQVLLEETGSQEDALAEVEDMFEVASASNPPVPSSPELDRFYLDVLASYGAPELALVLCGRTRE